MLTSHLQLTLNKRLGYANKQSLDYNKIISLANDIEKQYKVDTDNAKKYLKEKLKEALKEEAKKFLKEK